MTTSENDRRRTTMVHKMLRLEDKKKKLLKEVDKIENEINKIRDDIWKTKYEK